jgi:hypothetical protein
VNGRYRCSAGANYPERTHCKLWGKTSLREGNVADSIRENLHCLARELDFLVMKWNVSLDDTSEAAKSVVSTWMGARYMLQNGGNVVNLVFDGGLFQVEFQWSSLGLCCHDKDIEIAFDIVYCSSVTAKALNF